jgi:hypothetical protein
MIAVPGWPAQLPPGPQDVPHRDHGGALQPGDNNPGPGADPTAIMAAPRSPETPRTRDGPHRDHGDAPQPGDNPPAPRGIPTFMIAVTPAAADSMITEYSRHMRPRIFRDHGKA